MRGHNILKKKYANINGKVSKDIWQSMFRYFAMYVDSVFYIHFHHVFMVVRHEVAWTTSIELLNKLGRE